jgi:hypothetical protein
MVKKFQKDFPPNKVKRMVHLCFKGKKNIKINIECPIKIESTLLFFYFIFQYLRSFNFHMNLGNIKRSVQGPNNVAILTLRTKFKFLA